MLFTAKTQRTQGRKINSDGRKFYKTDLSLVGSEMLRSARHDIEQDFFFVPFVFFVVKKTKNLSPIKGERFRGATFVRRPEIERHLMRFVTRAAVLLIATQLGSGIQRMLLLLCTIQQLSETANRLLGSVIVFSRFD